MTITPRLSKALLTSHITFSLGWFGAVVVFLALAITGLTSENIQLIRSSLIAMELSAWFVIVPFCLISLFTGVLQAIVTKWGLFKHYWIIVKLFLTVASTILLLLHMQPISYLADLASGPSFSGSQHSCQIIDLISKAGAAILVLLVITTISVYKPWGRVQYELHNNQAKYIKMQDKGTTTKKSLRLYIAIGLIGLVVLFIVKHVVGGGMRHH